ncbi:RnfABCDGE type electron transport complex subunit D [Candidatus Bipolaricaulota bacterium]|nr:RnfABCDGE type electron transport complex subunit D [Candidatus Bipolaricaulota bacterium]
MESNQDSNYRLSYSPHIHTGTKTSEVMGGVALALIPAVAAGIYYFRLDAVYLLLTTVLTSLLSEALMLKILGKEVDLSDKSALVTGLLIGLVLPPEIPLYAAGLGSVFAIVIGKQLFGGLGKNIFNPALIGRAFLVAAYPVLMTTWTKPVGFDAVTSATPLAAARFDDVLTPLSRLFLGNISGSLGETSALALLLGGLYMLVKGYMDWRIPCAAFASLLGLSAIIWGIDPGSYSPPVFHLLAGGFLIGAIFMATDPTTSPVTKSGRWIFGAGVGIITVVIRAWGGYPEGVMFSILLMNAFRPLIDRFTVPAPFGGDRP